MCVPAPFGWLLVAFVATALPGQAPAFAAMTAELAAADSVDAAMVGEDGEETGTWRLFERWRARGTTAELLQCTEHPAPVVRAYAVRGLVANGADIDWSKLLRRVLADAAPVRTQCGCTVAVRPVGDVVFDDAAPKLSPDQLQDLAEFVLTDRTRASAYARDRVLRTVTLRDGMLHVVRELAAGGEVEAAIALARYRLPVDAPIVAACIDRAELAGNQAAFVAAAIHRDARLLEPLWRHRTAAMDLVAANRPDRLRWWLAAIAAQGSAAAAADLAELLATAVPPDRRSELELLSEFERALQSQADSDAFAALRRQLRQRRDDARR